MIKEEDIKLEIRDPNKTIDGQSEHVTVQKLNLSWAFEDTEDNIENYKNLATIMHE